MKCTVACLVVLGQVNMSIGQVISPTAGRLATNTIWIQQTSFKVHAPYCARCLQNGNKQLFDKEKLYSVQNNVGITQELHHLTSTVDNAAQQGFSPIFSSIPIDLIAQIQAYDQQYCEDFSYTPSEYIPAIFFGHSSDMTINLGECYLIKDKSVVDSEVTLECVKPEITFESIPMNYTSHHESAEEFCTKECEISVPFGHIPKYSEKVLNVFDGSMTLDVQALVQVMTNTISEILGTTKFDIADMSKFKLFQKP